MVVFCARVRAKKIQDFVFGQVFGHCYCTDCRAHTFSRAHILNVVTFFFFFFLVLPNYFCFVFMTQNNIFNVPSASKQNCLSSQNKTATEDFVHGQVLILATAIART